MNSFCRITLNTCIGCSKEQSHIFWLANKEHPQSYLEIYLYAFGIKFDIVKKWVRVSLGALFEQTW